jgi:hypothetical protein
MMELHHRTELHTLIEYGCYNSERLMGRALVEQFEDETVQRDDPGQTPLHTWPPVADPVGCRLWNAFLQANPKAPPCRITKDDCRLNRPIANCGMYRCSGRKNKRTIDTRDLRDDHYPFASATLSDQANINAIYYLLRAKPRHVLSCFHLTEERTHYCAD